MCVYDIGDGGYEVGMVCICDGEDECGYVVSVV